MYYEINEDLAKLAKSMNSFSDYEIGSQTAEYWKEVDEVSEIAENQKKRVSIFYHEKIDGMVDSFSRKLANWYNDNNRNNSSCPSILISGGSNFPVRKKEKQNARAETLFEEYRQIMTIPDKIRSIGTGAVDLADPHAREILNEQLEREIKASENAKKINAYYRKNKTVIGCPVISEKCAQKMQSDLEEIQERFPLHDVPYPSYELTSIRGKIKRLQERIEQLDKLQSIPEDESEKQFEGWKIVRNSELNRLQLIFDYKPDEETREVLKSNGFRWSPKNGAWQRQLTENAITAADRIIKFIEE